MGGAGIDARLAAAHQALQRGDAAGAAALASAVLAAAPDHPQALVLMAGLRRAGGDRAAALALIERALNAAPAAAPILFNRANLLLELGRAAEAVAGYDAVLAAQPDHLGARVNRARACAAGGAHDAACADYDRALAAAPSRADLWRERAAAAAKQGLHGDAAENLRTALSIDPRDADAWFNLGCALFELDRAEEAVAAYDAALEMTPEAAGVWDNRGAALHALDRLEEALASFDRALALRPDHADTYSNRGLTLFALKRADEAAASFDHALALAGDVQTPRIATMQYNRGMAFLARHDLQAGWAGFEARWAAGLVNSAPLGRGAPAWRGEDVRGTLHIWREQGIGDEVLFARLVPLARAQCARLVLECEPRLAALFARYFPDVEIVAAPDFSGGAAAQCALGGLGAALDIAAAELGGGAFLRADAARRAALRARYEELARGRPIIGIAWESKSPRRGAAKSAALAHWGALLMREALFVNLQYGETGAVVAEARALFGCDLHTDPDVNQMRDLDAFAAQVAAVDQVVSVSNTSVHMAGALGAPCIVMPPPARGRLWYWGLEGERTPWYSSLRIVRRETDEGWPAQIARAAALAFA